MPPDVEFNSEQNGLIVKSKSKTIRLYRIKRKGKIDVMLPEKRFLGFFTFFTSNVFLISISSKILKHISQDTEFCSIFEISAEPLLQNFRQFFRFVDSRSSTVE